MLPTLMSGTKRNWSCNKSLLDWSKEYITAEIVSHV